MYKVINWLKATFICSHRGHCYTHRIKKLRTFYCVRCGRFDPRITTPDGKRCIVATSQAFQTVEIKATDAEYVEGLPHLDFFQPPDS